MKIESLHASTVPCCLTPGRATLREHVASRASYLSEVVSVRMFSHMGCASAAHNLSLNSITRSMIYRDRI